MDELYEHQLKQCNRTELVSLAAERGIRTHYGVNRQALIDAMLHGTEVPPNPFDHDRSELMRILKKYERQLRGQVECHANCFRHADGYVVRCTLRATDVFKRERNANS